MNGLLFAALCHLRPELDPEWVKWKFATFDAFAQRVVAHNAHVQLAAMQVKLATLTLKLDAD